MEKGMSIEKLNEIKIQLEYYLSDDNLKKDSFFHEKISSEPNGYLSLEFILKCNKIIKAKWTKDELVQGAKLSDLIEVDVQSEKIRRKGNKPLPELSLLSKKRKKEEKEEEPDEEESQKETIDPIILEVSSKEETTKWKKVLETFKNENPELNVVYGRFRGKEGHFAVLPTNGKEIEFKDKFTNEEIEFEVKKCQGDNLIDFWKNHGSHYELCTNKTQKKKGKNGKKEKKSKKKPTYLEEPLKLGKDIYRDITLIRAKARKILSIAKDDVPIEGDDKDFILDILKFHEHYEEKIKDMKNVITGKPQNYTNSRCFFIEKTNGDKVDFSIQKCIEKIEEEKVK